MEDCDYYDASAVKGGSIEVMFFWGQQDCLGSILDIGGSLLSSPWGAAANQTRFSKQSIQGLKDA